MRAGASLGHEGPASLPHSASGLARAMDTNEDGLVVLEEFLYFYRSVIYDIPDDQFERGPRHPNLLCCMPYASCCVCLWKASRTSTEQYSAAVKPVACASISTSMMAMASTNHKPSSWLQLSRARTAGMWQQEWQHWSLQKPKSQNGSASKHGIDYS